MTALTGLVTITLPTRTIRLSDGGFTEFEGEIYRSTDDVFGSIGSLEAVDEGVGEEIPALSMQMFPPDASAAADLSQPGFQQSRVTFHLAEYDPATGVIVGTPDLLFDGQIDQTTLRVGRAERTLPMQIVSRAERFFEVDIGNSLSPTFHQSVWPGELGHNNATGLVIPQAWGTESPARSGGSGGGGGGFLREWLRRKNAY